MPPLHASLRARAVQPVLAGLKELGHDAAAIAARAGIDEAVLSDPDQRVPRASMQRLWEGARELSGDANIAMHAALAAPVSSFELPAYSILASPTLREAFRRASRYQRLLHEVNDLVFEEREGEGVLRHTLPGGRAASRQPAEFLVTSWVRFGSMVTAGDAWTPLRVRFAHAEPDDASEHRRLFGESVQFSSGLTALHVGAGVLDRPNPRADANLVLLLDRYAQSMIGPQKQSTLSSRVREWIEHHPGELAPTAVQAAQAMNMSLRTLHRALAAEGMSYRELLDQFRRERASALLDDRHVSIAEIAFLLGFSDVSAFHRAFKRWTGTTPAAFRRR